MVHGPPVKIITRAPMFGKAISSSETAMEAAAPVQRCGRQSEGTGHGSRLRSARICGSRAGASDVRWERRATTPSDSRAEAERLAERTLEMANSASEMGSKNLAAADRPSLGVGPRLPARPTPEMPSCSA
eukprot:scaffold43248_cov31-Tisochrysis_lutea.AAC.2